MNTTLNQTSQISQSSNKIIKMDHSMMDHSKMGHSMPDHSMPEDMCNMNMLFTWDYKNMCVIFKWWHVKSLSSLIITLIALVGLGVGYEFFKSRAKRYESSLSSVNILEGDEEGLGTETNYKKSGVINRFQKAVYYGLLVGYSYMMMLVFMTYNGWAMLSVVLGAILGNYLYGGEINDSLACH